MAVKFLQEFTRTSTKEDILFVHFDKSTYLFWTEISQQAYKLK